MGRKALHTPEQVFQAAERLAAAGQAVSPTALREALGGGSLTTIYKHLAVWEATHQPLFKPITQAMPETVEKAFAHAWQIAAGEAGKDIVAIREKSEAEVKMITQRFEEALNNIAQLETEADAEATQRETLESALAASQSEVAQIKADAAARESVLVASQEQIQQQLERQQAEYRELNKENKEIIAQCAKLKGQLETLQIQSKEQSALLAKAFVSSQ